MPNDRIEYRSDFKVNLLADMGSDDLICKAARVSTVGVRSMETKESAGLIDFLMRNRHGSPFEHGSMVFRIEAPIFVWREFMRHRIGFSYNEQSGRYMELDPVFYIPPRSRNLVQVGKPGAYEYVGGSEALAERVEQAMTRACGVAWSSYQDLLKSGVAREVARMVLPVNVYSTAYVTCNPRSLMSFLSLRTKSDESTYKSFPMWEINCVANMMERVFKDLYPLTHTSFDNNGRVSP